MTDNAINTRTASPAGLPSACFCGWHPLKSDWMEELAEETKAIARDAQQYLRDRRRTDQELADALAQIQAWKHTHRSLINDHAPEVIGDEGLGSRLAPDAFIRFLLTQPSPLPLEPSEFAALALLLEIYGRAELDVVAKKHAFSIAAQHMTLNIGRLHTAATLLRMMDDPSLRGAAHTVLSVLFSGRAGEASNR